MRFLWILVALGSVQVAPVTAQDSGVHLYVFPKLGVFTSVSTLAEFDGREFDLDSNVALGLGIELQLPSLRFGLRGNLAYQTGTELLTRGEALSDDDNTILVVTADLVYRIGGDAQIRPYVLGGAGVKHYGLEARSVSALDGSATDFTLHAGGGVEINLGFTRLAAEVSDYISWFKPEDRGSSKMQNDIFGMVGVRIGLF